MNRISRAAAAAALLSLTVLTSAAVAVAPTTPDTGFSGDGRLVLHSASTSEAFAAMKVLPAGQMVVVVLTQDEPAVQVYKLRRNGTPDPAFGGGDGVDAFALAANYEDVRVAVDPWTSKIYVTTFLDNGSTSPTTVWRLNANGTLDLPYGGSNQGHVVFNQRLVHGLTPAPGGRLVMVGDDFAAHAATAWQLTSTGSPDAAFGSSGTKVLSASSNDEATSVVRQPNGRLSIAGSHYDPTASLLTAFRLTSAGQFDLSFSGDGKASINPSSTGTTTSTVWSPQVLVRPDGRTVYVAGLNQNSGGFRTSLLLAGLTVSGAADTTTGRHVFTKIAEYDGQAVLERDGKVLATGFLPPSPSTTGAVVRFTARGALDPSWSGDGILPFSGADRAADLGIDQWGHLRLGRLTGSSAPYDTTLQSFVGTPTPTCNGRLATQFGGNGNDTITGTAGNDVLVGLSGRDTIRGLGGNDLICGGAGADSLYGGIGADRIYGNAGNDLIVGGPGADHLYGGPGADSVH